MLANSDVFFNHPSPYASISLEVSHLYLMNVQACTLPVPYSDTALLTSITTIIIIITLKLSGSNLRYVNHICI